MTVESGSETRSFWRSGWGIALCVFLALAVLAFILEHQLHALQWLPYALLLACPLLHFFMHRGHHHGGDARRKSRDPEQ